MPLVDAIIAIAQSYARGEWTRYCEIALRILGNVPHAPRTLLERRLRHVSYPFTLDAEVVEIEDVFLERFVAAVATGHCCARGVPPGGAAVVNIPPVLITVETIKRLRGDRWELPGGTWHGIDVVAEAAPTVYTIGAAQMDGTTTAIFDGEGTGRAQGGGIVLAVGDQPPLPHVLAPAQLPAASDDKIHIEIKAEYAAYKERGVPGPSAKLMRKPVQDRLGAKELYATGDRIEDLARHKQYDEFRRRPGRPRK